MISRIKLSYRNLALIALILGVVSYTFVQSKQRGMHETIPHPIGRHRMLIGIAISDLQYGLKGYIGYDKVNNTLANNGMSTNSEVLNNYSTTIDEILNNEKILNDSIKRSLNLDVSSSNKYMISREDKGGALYYKLSFLIFGYNIQGFFYLYFLLFSISVFIYLLTFYRRVEFLNILLLIICSHFIIVSAAPTVGLQLQTVSNGRFIPVLAILPSLYLALLILGKYQLTLLTLISAFIQTLILILTIHIRSSALYQIMFLCTTFGLGLLWNWSQNSTMGKYVLNKIFFWPLAIVFFCFLLLKWHMLVDFHHSYTKTQSKHLFWHAVYVGLGTHPDSWNKYEILPNDDSAIQFAKKYAKEHYGININSATDAVLYESILKDKFFKILSQDPRLVVESFLYYKPILFINNYFSFFFGAVNNLLKWTILAIVIFSGVISNKVFLKKWFEDFPLIFLLLIFSLLPSILVVPEPHLIADPALLFTLVIFMIISGAICYIFQQDLIPGFFSRRHVNS